MKVSSFQDVFGKEMTEALIRSDFPFSAGYRFFPAIYKKEPEFSTNFMWPVRIYVLSGSCVFTKKSDSGLSVEHAEVVEGSFVDLEPGRYYLLVGEGGVKLMNVYFIPDLIEQKSKL